MNQVKAPAALLAELGVSSPGDIIVEAIAEYCGATIVYEPLDGCEARILGIGDRAIITVNADSPRSRQRFSAAHELGHWMRDRGKLAFSCTDRNLIREWGDDNPERRANRYSADLLLPSRLFVPETKGLPATFESARQLATTFETSITATAIRLAEIGDAPAMIVCNDASRRRWFHSSSLVRIWPLPKPGSSTEAAKLLSGKIAQSKGPTEVDADEWIEHPRSSEYTLMEDSVVAGGVVMSLLWWKDERQLLELDGDDGDADLPLSGHLSFQRRTKRR